jgi:hypothetical protein
MSENDEARSAEADSLISARKPSYIGIVAKH